MGSSESKPHISVLKEEFLAAFRGQKLRYFFDGTLGAGGHAKAILEEHPEIELLIGCDQDPNALAIARENLREHEGRVRIFQGNFSKLDRYLDEVGVKEVDGFFLTSECRLCS